MFEHHIRQLSDLSSASRVARVMLELLETAEAEVEVSISTAGLHLIMVLVGNPKAVWSAFLVVSDQDYLVGLTAEGLTAVHTQGNLSILVEMNPIPAWMEEWLPSIVLPQTVSVS